MVSYACAYSQSELGKYFEWIIICIILLKMAESRWGDSCVLIGYLSGRDGPILPSWYLWHSNSGCAINPLLTTSLLGLMTWYWPALSLFFFIEIDFAFVHKNAKMNRVILLQIVMVSPGTHLVKNHESQSRTIYSQFKKCVQNWKCLDLYVTRQLIRRQTPKLCITVFWN